MCYCTFRKQYGYMDNGLRPLFTQINRQKRQKVHTFAFPGLVSQPIVGNSFIHTFPPPPLSSPPLPTNPSLTINRPPPGPRPSMFPNFRVCCYGTSSFFGVANVYLPYFFLLLLLFLIHSLVSFHPFLQDILEKIRECGSSVTYYGGRVLNNHSQGVSPIAKAIMREIHSEDNICGVCQPHNCPHSSKLFTSFCTADNNSHLGKYTNNNQEISKFIYLCLALS